MESSHRESAEDFQRMVELLPRKALEQLVLTSFRQMEPISLTLVRTLAESVEREIEVDLGEAVSGVRDMLKRPHSAGSIKDIKIPLRLRHPAPRRLALDLNESYSDSTSIPESPTCSVNAPSSPSLFQPNSREISPPLLTASMTSPTTSLSPVTPLPDSLLAPPLPGPCVILVGAGPGDPALLTLAAHKALQEAEAVICDGLVSEELRRLIPAHVPLHIASKTCGKQHAVQSDLNSLSLHHLTLSRRVVRLKGGDPFVFGRGLEEAHFFTRGNPESGTPGHDSAYPPFSPVPVQVIPGVSSALAGAAAAGIPVTHRGVAREVCVVTAKIESGSHGVSNAAMPGYAAGGRTVVVMMGVKEIRAVVRGLIKRRDDAWPVETPVALVERATTPHQRVVRGTLADIADMVEATVPAVTNQSVIVVGRVVGVATDWECVVGSLPKVDRTCTGNKEDLAEADSRGISVQWTAGGISMVPKTPLSG
ncbi:hypothetical protein HDU93_009478 [Gonapodya sp. JEL0774]|nr:hypothetical protein HDU93_009478 [Gonapodya sp. JEL0774]